VSGLLLPHPRAELAAIVYTLIVAMPDHKVTSVRLLFAELRKGGQQVRDESVRSAVDDLLVAGLLTEVSGKRGARGYQAILTASQPSPDTTASVTASASASPLREGRGTQSRNECVGRSRTQSDAVEEKPDEQQDDPQ